MSSTMQIKETIANFILENNIQESYHNLHSLYINDLFQVFGNSQKIPEHLKKDLIFRKRIYILATAQNTMTILNI